VQTPVPPQETFRHYFLPRDRCRHAISSRAKHRTRINEKTVDEFKVGVPVAMPFLVNSAISLVLSKAANASSRRRNDLGK